MTSSSSLSSNCGSGTAEVIYTCATCTWLSSHITRVRNHPELSGLIIPDCAHLSHNYILLDHGSSPEDCDDYVEKEPESAGFEWAGVHGLDAGRLRELFDDHIRANLIDKTA